MKNLNSAIYMGVVKHQRFLPMKHCFSYKIFMLLLDLDELPELFDKYWLWSARKPNVAYFRRRDHLGDPSTNLRDAVVKLVTENSGYRPQGKIFLLTHLRYWGYCFNPVSFYYCFDKHNEDLEAIVAEVHNTPWNEQHCYVLTKEQNFGTKERHHYKFNKQFHVSPLMPMDMQYDWRFTVPREKIFVHMKNFMQEQEHFNATLHLQRRIVNSQSLSKVLINYPFMTLKIITNIYWQALRTKLKGAVFYSHPKMRKM